MKTPNQTTLNELEVLRGHISQLALVSESEAPVISAYFDLCQPVDALRSRLNDWSAAARTTFPSDQRRAFDESRHEVGHAILKDWPESCRSLAVFARSGSNPILRVMPFSATLDTHFQASPLPSIFPLVQLKDRFHRFVVVIATDENSRIFEVTLGAVSEDILTIRPEFGSRLGRDWGREHFHQKKRESDRLFHRDQVTIITNLMSRRGHNHLILAGNPRHVAGLRDALPKHIATRLVGELYKMPSGGDCSVVLEQAVATFIEAERAESHDTVTRLHEQVCREALAVVGVACSRDAILGGYAAELVISEELTVADRENLVRLATASDLPIEVCEGDELLATHGGVGCLLRYRPDFLVTEAAMA